MSNRTRRGYFVMRNLCLFLCVLFFVACTKPSPNIWLAGLAAEIGNAEYELDGPLSITFRMVEVDNQRMLRCRVHNVSGESIEVRHTQLPWNNPMIVRIVAIRLNGSVLPTGTGVVSVLIPDSESREVMAPGAWLEGDFDLKNYFEAYDSFPTDEDVLLLWSYAQGQFTGIVPFRKS